MKPKYNLGQKVIKKRKDFCDIVGKIESIHYNYEYVWYKVCGKWINENKLELLN